MRHVAVQVVVRRGLVGDDVREDVLARAGARAGRRRWPRPRSTPPPGAPAPAARAPGRRRATAPIRRDSASPAASRCASDRPRRPGRRPRSSSPRAAGRRPCHPGPRSPSAGRRGCRRSAAGAARPRSRRFPGGSPGCRCRSTSRRSSGRTSSGPSPSRRRNSSMVAQRGTRFELAISTRGASAWLLKTATGLPDCTSRVSSSSRRRRAATMASKQSQLRAALPDPP